MITRPFVAFVYLLRSFPDDNRVMTTLTISKGIYTDTVEETRGQDFQKTAARLNERAATLEELSRQMGTEIKDVVPEAKSPQENAKKDIDELSDETKAEIEGALAGVKNPEEAGEVLADAAKDVLQGAEDLRKAANGKEMINEKHEGDILGQAKLGKEGSQSGDAAKLAGEKTLVDAEKAAGLVEHEFEHTQQAEQTVTEVAVDDKPAQPVQKPVSNTLGEKRNDGTVDATELVETAAMIQQKKRAAASFQTLASSYKATYAKVLSELPDEAKIVEYARRSDGLEQFGKDVRARKGIVEPQVTMAA